MKAAPAPAQRAQFWGGNRDGEWFEVTDQLRENKELRVEVLGPTIEDGKKLTTITTVTEIYQLRFSKPRAQWYLVWSGYGDSVAKK